MVYPVVRFYKLEDIALCRLLYSHLYEVVGRVGDTRLNNFILRHSHIVRDSKHSILDLLSLVCYKRLNWYNPSWILPALKIGKTGFREFEKWGRLRGTYR